MEYEVVQSKIKNMAIYAILILFLLHLLLLSLSIIKYYVLNCKDILKNSCFYYGRVQHTRLKGGAVHHLDYPIFFSSVDLHEMKAIGWLLWPLFAVNGGIWTYCSLDYDEHLKGWEPTNASLLDRLKSFIAEKSNHQLDIQITSKNNQKTNSFINNQQITSTNAKANDSIQLMTHLTYFGYCFNPVSFYYIYKNRNEAGDQDENENDDINLNPNQSNRLNVTNRDIDFVVTEVSNTPWIEQHSYLLHECMKDVSINRDNDNNKKNSNKEKDDEHTFQAIWNKDFHVSPFMEMDYIYDFTHSRLGERVWVKSKLIKQSTKEIWFTANFNLKRIDFTPWNLLYVLTFYPIQTRLIQVYIHIEAFKLWWKGVPTFSHPKGSIIHFGFGITDKLLLDMIVVVNRYMSMLCKPFSSRKETKVE